MQLLLLCYLQYRQLPQSSFLRQPAQSPQKTLFRIPFPPFPVLAPRVLEGGELTGEEVSSMRILLSAGPSSALSLLPLRESGVGSVPVAGCTSTTSALLSVTSGAAGFCCFLSILEESGLAGAYWGKQVAEVVPAMAL